MVYKGMLTTPQLEEFYADLRDERLESALRARDSRFSTNTFPSWPLAHSVRYIAHNGEINTLKGNPQLDARGGEALLARICFPESSTGRSDLHPDGSDSASFDEVLELLASSAEGRSRTRC